MLLLACSATDPCDSFAGLSCITLEVRGAGAIDQIVVHPLVGFSVSDERSPTTPRRIDLPVQLAVLPGGQFMGPFELEVRGLLEGATIGTDRVHADLKAAEHLRLFANLRPVDVTDGALPDLVSVDLGSVVPDLAGIDLAGADLSAAPDLATAVGWQPETLPVAGPIIGIFGTSSKNVYALSSAAILHSTGDGNWSVEHSAVNNQIFFAISGSAADDLWAGGGIAPCATTCAPVLLHSTGNGTWTQVTNLPAPTNKAPAVHAIGAADKSDAFLGIQGGDSDFLHTTNGVDWLPESVGAARVPVDSLLVLAADRAFAATSAGAVVQTGGTGSWTSVDTLTDFGNVFLFGTAANDLYAAASALTRNESRVFHFAGSGKFAVQFDDSPSTANGHAVGISGSGPGDLYAAFGFAIKHSSGDGHWNDETLPTFNEIVSIWVAPDGQVFAGTDDTILHKR